MEENPLCHQSCLADAGATDLNNGQAQANPRLTFGAQIIFLSPVITMTSGTSNSVRARRLPTRCSSVSPVGSRGTVSVRSDALVLPFRNNHVRPVGSVFVRRMVAVRTENGLPASQNANFRQECAFQARLNAIFRPADHHPARQNHYASHADPIPARSNRVAQAVLAI